MVQCFHEIQLKQGAIQFIRDECELIWNPNALLNSVNIASSWPPDSAKLKTKSVNLARFVISFSELGLIRLFPLLFFDYVFFQMYCKQNAHICRTKLVLWDEMNVNLLKSEYKSRKEPSFTVKFIVILYKYLRKTGLFVFNINKYNSTSIRALCKRYFPIG